MAHAPNLVGLFEDWTMLLPCCRIEYVLGVVMQHPQAIIGRPTAAGRIDNERVPIAFEHLRPFTNGHRDPFPGLFRRPNIIRILASSWRGPNTHTRVLPDPRDVARVANENLPFIPRFGIIVVPAVENHPRVGRMRWQDRVNKITFVAR